MPSVFTCIAQSVSFKTLSLKLNRILFIPNRHVTLMHHWELEVINHCSFPPLFVRIPLWTNLFRPSPPPIDCSTNSMTSSVVAVMTNLQVACHKIYIDVFLWLFMFVLCCSYLELLWRKCLFLCLSDLDSCIFPLLKNRSVFAHLNASESIHRSLKPVVSLSGWAVFLFLSLKVGGN